MSIMEIQKKFYEEKTGGFFDTLAAAKKACKYPHILRVWLRDGKTIGRRTFTHTASPAAPSRSPTRR